MLAIQLALAMMLQAAPTAQVSEQPVAPSVDEATAQAVETTAEEEAQNDDDKVVCRRTAIIGSKFKKKVCATKAEWRALSRRSSETAKEMQRRGKGLDPVS